MIPAVKAYSFRQLGEDIDNVLHIHEESELEKIGKEIGKGLDNIAKEAEKDLKIVEDAIEDEIAHLDKEGETAYEDAFGNYGQVKQMIMHFLANIVSGLVILYRKISEDFESFEQNFGINNWLKLKKLHTT